MSVFAERCEIEMLMAVFGGWSCLFCNAYKIECGIDAFLGTILVPCFGRGLGPRAVSVQFLSNGFFELLFFSAAFLCFLFGMVSARDACEKFSLKAFGIDFSVFFFFLLFVVLV